MNVRALLDAADADVQDGDPEVAAAVRRVIRAQEMTGEQVEFLREAVDRGPIRDHGAANRSAALADMIGKELASGWQTSPVPAFYFFATPQGVEVYKVIRLTEKHRERTQEGQADGLRAARYEAEVLRHTLLEVAEGFALVFPEE
jgi:hypothetical protein